MVRCCGWRLGLTRRWTGSRPLLRTAARRHTDVRSESVHGRRGSDHQPTIDQNDNPREDGQFSWQGTRAWAWCVLLALPPRLPMPPRGVNPRVPRKNVVSKPVLPPIGGLAALRMDRAAANRTVRCRGRQAAAAARRRRGRPRPTMECRRRPSRRSKVLQMALLCLSAVISRFRLLLRERIILEGSKITRAALLLL